jgi:hypothetical protein
LYPDDKLWVLRHRAGFSADDRRRRALARHVPTIAAAQATFLTRFPALAATALLRGAFAPPCPASRARHGKAWLRKQNTAPIDFGVLRGRRARISELIATPVDFTSPRCLGLRRLRGSVQSMFCAGYLMSQVLRWTQFCALITKRGFVFDASSS